MAVVTLTVVLVFVISFKEAERVLRKNFLPPPPADPVCDPGAPRTSVCRTFIGKMVT